MDEIKENSYIAVDEVDTIICPVMTKGDNYIYCKCSMCAAWIMCSETTGRCGFVSFNNTILSDK